MSAIASQQMDARVLLLTTFTADGDKWGQKSPSEAEVCGENTG
jgi:hypothetical protein